MKKVVQIAIGILVLLQPVAGTSPEGMLVFTYEKPYTCELIDGSYMVRAAVEGLSSARGLEVRFNGEILALKEGEKEAVHIWLPLIGDPGVLEISSKDGRKKAIRSQYFEPLIPADWDYFGTGKIHVISSSHQDIAWMNTPDSCRHERVHDIVVPALDLIENEPDFKFEMEQTLNLIEACEDAPGYIQRYINTYRSGNFEWGATFTQPYEGLESGEQLVRQSYFGRRWIKKNLPGMDARVAYNIDVPGRSLQVPQLFSKSGIDYLFVSRMKEGFYHWYSPDGSRIFTYSPGNYGWSLLVYKYLEEDAVTAMHKLHKVLQNWNAYYRERNLPPHYALVISTDAGGPRSYRRVIDAWNEIAENSGVAIPEIAHSTALEFLKEVDAPEAKIDSIYGERPNLWLYIHGAGHYQAIKAKRKAAVSLPAAEIFNTIHCQLKKDFSAYPQEELDRGWYNAIYPDHGWGGKNGHITDSLFQVALETGNLIGEHHLQASLNSIADEVELKSPGNILVFNDLSWNRDGTVSVDISHLKGDRWVVADGQGNILPAQILSAEGRKELTFSLNALPSIGYQTFVVQKGKVQADRISVGANYCDNQFYEIRLGPGGITRLYDKELKKEVFNTSTIVGGELYHMGYNGNGAGEFTQITAPNYDRMERAHEEESNWSLLESGPVYSRFRSTFQMISFSVEQVITVFHQKKQIDLEVVIPDWPGQHNRQVRVLFPLDMKAGAQISYDVPMGMVHVGKDELKQSPQGWAWGGTYHQMPEEIHPREIQNFMTASGNGFGFTMSTDIVTADWIDPSREAVDYPVINSVLLSSHKSCHGQGNWYDQQGSHTFKFSITSHQEGWKNGFHFGLENNHPLHTIVRPDKQKGTLPSGHSFVSTSDPFARITTMKKAEDDSGVVMRLVEAEGVDKEIQLDLSMEVTSISKTNMIEEEPEPLGQQGKVLKLQLGKHAVETYKMSLKK